MDISEKKSLKNKIAKRRELNIINSSRWNRFLKAPLYSLEFYIKQAIAYIHPYKVRRKTLWGDTMEYYLPEAASVYYYGFWEVGLTNYLVNTLNEGDVFLDVGAHVGFYSLLASNLVGKNGKVYAFEPTPRTFASLKKNLQSKDNSESHNVAVLNKEDKIKFTDYGPKYSAFNSFKKRTDEDTLFLQKGIEIEVPAISLDKFCSNKNIKPTFIKIDVEGAEHVVLESMTQILTEIRPSLSIEVSGSADLKDNTETSVKFLQKLDYIGFIINEYGELSPCQPGDEYKTDNLVFIHSSKSNHE